jgi:outer membrane protein OmpA-like peptidoglycan-associated protein
MLKRVALAAVAACAISATTFAQTSGSAQSQSTTSPSMQSTSSSTSQSTQTPTQTTQSAPTTTSEDVRPATTTPMGDTGLWFVPSAEILPHKRWSVSAYRVNFDYQQGFTDVSNWPVTFGFGIKDRVEVFGALTAVRRIDRDSRPIFRPGDPDSGGLINDYPFVGQGWSDNQLGDFWLGGKLNFLAEHRQQPFALAVRGLVKLPTAKDDDEGVGTGKPDFIFDAIVSKEINQRVELSGFGGFIVRGDPNNVNLSNGLRWGVGAAFPTRRSLRLTAELHGESQFDDVVYSGSSLVGLEDGSLPPLVSAKDSFGNFTLGLTWQGRRGVFAGAGVNWRFAYKGRSDFGSFDDETGDAIGFQFRVGYHPGVRVYAPPPPPPPPPPPAPPAKPDHVLGVKASCNPCTVEVGKVSTVTAVATSSINCVVTYNWTAPAGTFSDRTQRVTPWTAPNNEGPVPVTITVTCPQDGKTASDTVNINVIRPAVQQITFEDVHFDFDRYSLRPEATRALDEAIKALQGNPNLRIQIEGHTCNIGTAEYNLALGDRRANSVREYLTSRGVGADRLGTVSYGEERPKHDNAREETRRLNRRAALTVKVQ